MAAKNRRTLSLERLNSRQLMAADLAVGADLDVAEPNHAETAEPVCYLKYKLDRCFVKSWSTSGDADDRPTEEVAPTAETTTATDLDMAWDNTKHIKWGDSGVSLTPDAVDEAFASDADDRPTEEVAFYYNKIGFAYAKTTK